MAEARLAQRLTARLSHQSLPHDIEQRLRIGRMQAVQRAAEKRRAAALAPAVGPVAWSGRLANGAVAALAGGPQDGSRWWQRIGMVLPLLVLLAGLYGIDQWSLRETVLAAAEVDALLLSDDLPPAAYTDPGFGEFLRSPAD